MDTILSNRWKVYYDADNGQKRVERDTSETPTVTDSVNALYSALQDLFDELNQMDDGTPMSAQTPTEYTIGVIDSGDTKPWFIDHRSVEYLTGGAIKTNKWNRVEGTNTGIVRMAYTWTTTNLAASDIGKTITMDTDGDTGTILDIIDTGALAGEIWIRPATNAAGNSFDNSVTAGDTFTVTGGTATDGVQATAAVTGEMLWANAYSIGTIATNTHLYINQSSAAVSKYSNANTDDWWSDGHIDILLQVKEPGAIGTGSSFVDDGYVTVLARRFGANYDYFSVDLSAGGRNPIPLATGTDLDNPTGYGMLNCSGGTGTFNVGDVIGDTDDTATAVKLGIITAITNPGTDPDIEYYLIGDPVTDFEDTDTLYSIDDSGQADIDTVDTNGSAALGTPPTITQANTDVDVDEDGSTEPYSITLDCNQNSLADVWEWIKYATRRSNSGDIDNGSVTEEGQFYIGNQLQVPYSSQTGGFVEDEVLWLHDTSNVLVGYGTVVADHDGGTSGDVILKNIRLYGSWSDVTQMGDDIAQASYTDYASVTGANIRVITPTKQSPLGTFAGGTFFAAPGVVVTDYLTAEENSFQCIDDDGTVNAHPTKVTATVTNTRLGDKVAVFRLTGGEINKQEYSAAAGGTTGDTDVVVGSAIASDVPGKAAGGVLRLIDVDGAVEYRLPFTSWLTSTFTLDSVASTACDTADEDTITDTGAFAGRKVGDLIRNTTAGGVTYITEIVSNDEVTVFPPITGQTDGDSYEVNTVPFDYDGSDYVYVPIIDTYETTGTSGSPGDELVNLTYGGDIPVRIRVRNAGNILPFETDSSIKSSGMSVAAIRTADAIYSAV